ncbi:hypothetical protein M0805_005657 [Coniferiporia weirii]|nr:hypothetical protein M0805_005657 [Coniferiporia weirii]
MAATKWQVTQLASHEFVNCAGSVLFCPPTGDKPLQICLLHHLTKDEWLLPKGRQDQGESLAQAALRETYEETGYPCLALPVDMHTRSPPTGVDMKDRPHFVRACTEPFTVSLRHVSPRNIKFIWWFVSRTAEHGVPERRDGTQMKSENFVSVMCGINANVDDEQALDAAVARLTYANDREIAKMAIRLVLRTYPGWSSSAHSSSGQRG